VKEQLGCCMSQEDMVGESFFDFGWGGGGIIINADDCCCCRK
jgi:hypothetical protein